MSDLAIYDMDRTVTRRATYTPFLLHCALRRAPWRLAASCRSSSLSMLAYVARLIDRAQAQGDQPSPAARRHRSIRATSSRWSTASPTQQVASNIRPGARAAIARDKARRPPAGARDRLLPPLRRRDRRAPRLRRRDRHRLDHRPRRARPREDRRRELLRPGEAADDRRLGRKVRPDRRSTATSASIPTTCPTRRRSNGRTSRSR